MMLACMVGQAQSYRGHGNEPPRMRESADGQAQRMADVGEERTAAEFFPFLIIGKFLFPGHRVGDDGVRNDGRQEAFMTDICAGHDRVLYVLRQLFVGDAAVDDVIRHVAHGHFAVDFVRRDDVDVGIAFQGMADIVCRFRRLQLQDLVDIAVAVPDGEDRKSVV